jgi:hypothetical protein
MRRELYTIDVREDAQRRVEVLHLALEVEARYDDGALTGVREYVVAWCAKHGYEFCGLSIARPPAGAGGEAFVVARVRNLAPRRMPVTRSGRPIADPVERLVPTMAARRRSDSAGRT